jgi:hypothetical protein
MSDFGSFSDITQKQNAKIKHGMYSETRHVGRRILEAIFFKVYENWHEKSDGGNAPFISKKRDRISIHCLIVRRVDHLRLRHHAHVRQRPHHRWLHIRQHLHRCLDLAD